MKRALAGLIGLLAAGCALAHPLGNNTVNRQAGLQIQRTSLDVRYLLDLAEIPTLLAAADADVSGDGTTTAGEWEAYVRRYGELIRDGLDTRVNDEPLNLSLAKTQWELVPGAAGLNTLRIEARLSAALTEGGLMKIAYRDHRHPDEQGWKEVFVQSASDVRLEAADLPSGSLSQDLRVYPANGEVPNVLMARFEAAPTPSATRAPSSAIHAAGRQAEPARSIPPQAARRAEQQAIGPPASRSTGSTDRFGRAAHHGPSAPPAELPAWAFFRLGVHHIASGWDHLVFLLGLLVAQASLRRLVWVVTAFTAAHSLTLGLAASGLISLPGAWVEPAIALTIAYVGLSNLLGYSRHNATLAFAFGLVHGFGFAGALAQSMGTLRVGGGSWLLDLAAFNIGIETFQLALILALLPLLRWATRLSWCGAAFNAASFAVMSAGLGWFFTRI